MSKPKAHPNDGVDVTKPLHKSQNRLYPLPSIDLQKKIAEASQAWHPLVLKKIVAFGGVFVTGTDTEIGKTWVSASLLYALKQAGVDCIGMKPVASGAQKISGQWVNEDSSLHLWACRLRNAPIDLINPYIFEEAIAPHIAAEHQGVKIRKSVILNAYVYLKKSYPRYCVVVEGAGGILVPLSAKWNMAKLAQKMELPIVLVVGIRLGAINHALLSYELILQKNLPWAGWVANVVDANLSAHRSLLESHLAFLQAKMGKPLAVIDYMGQLLSQ